MTTTIPHPASWLTEQASTAIRQHAREAETLRDLHPQQLAAIRDNGWMKMYVPAQYGGLDLALPDILRIEEALAWCDGSTAWVVTLCSGAGWFAGFIDPALAGALFAGDDLCVAGSGAVSGVAEITRTGYILNGHWKYASGVLHATAVTMNCAIHDNGHPVCNADGSPRIAAFIVPRDHVVLHADWTSMGMMATGSHSFSVHNVAVTPQYCFAIDPACAVLTDPIYRYPFLQLALTTLSVNLSGMALRFLELADEILSQAAATGRENAIARRELADARATLDTGRERFYQAVDASWCLLLADGRIPDQQLSEVSEACQTLVQHLRNAVNRLYPRCGLSAASMETEINRVWRNLHTAAQHALFNNN